MLLRFIIFLVSILIVISNFLVYHSYQDQRTLIEDAANGEFKLSISEVNEINYYYPSLALNSVPILAYISNYYSSNNDYQLAINKLLFSLNKNPYNPYSKYILSRNYIMIKDLSRAENVLNEIFNDFPKLTTSTALYISVLGENQNFTQLKNIYKIIVDNDNKVIWNYYLSALELSAKTQEDKVFLENVTSYFYKKF